MKLLLGTNNAGKVIEISEALSTLPIDFLTPKQLKIVESPIETGATFLENAALKAKFYHGLSSHPTLADDSGIMVEALSNELGIHTRRWGAGPEASDEEWIEYFLKRMKEEENKRASFVCTLAYIDLDGELHTFEGRCDGHITDHLEAPYLPGLPLSACFKPENENAVFSALSLDQKNSTSHRGKALKSLRTFLEEHF